MKKFYSLVALLVTLMVGTNSATASDFTDSNKRAGTTDVFYTVGEWQTSYSDSKIASLTTDQAMTAVDLFNCSLYYISDGIVYQMDTNHVATPKHPTTVGEKFVSAYSNNVYFVDFYQFITDAEGTTLKIEDHGDWGSKVSEAASLDDASIKAKVGDITNNGPQTGLQKSVAAAIKSFEARESAVDDFGKDPKTRLNDDLKGFKKMYEDLELVRDSLGILYQFAHSKQTSYVNAKNETVNLDLKRDVIAYPAAQDIFDGVWDAMVDSYKNSEDYEGIASIGNMIVSTVQQLGDNTQQYDEESLDFYDKLQNPGSIVITTSGKYPAVDRLWVTDYAFCVLNPTVQIATAIKTFVTDQAKWTATAPTPASAVSKAIDVAMLAIKLGSAGNLMARDIMLLVLHNKVADWLDKDCTDDRSHEFLSEQLRRSVGIMMAAESASAVKTEYDILTKMWDRAKELQKLGEEQTKLQDLLFQAQDLFYEMDKYRAITNNGAKVEFQAKPNLRTYLNYAAEAVRTDYSIKTVTYNYGEGQNDLFDAVIVSGDKVYASDETPSAKTIREYNRLKNAMDLFAKQYELEQKLDETYAYKDSLDIAIKGVDGVKAGACQKTLNDAWTAGEAFNLDVTAMKKLLADIDPQITALNDAMAEAKTEYEKIQGELDETQKIIDELVNNGPLDKLEDALEKAFAEFQTNTDYNEVIKYINEVLIPERNWDLEQYDQPDNYLGGTPDGVFPGMISKAQEFYDNNKMYMTPTQIAAIDNALAIARTALAEWNDRRYTTDQDQPDMDQLGRDYLLKRMYYAALALEYVEKMTISNGSVDPDQADKQLAEAIVLVAIAAAATNDEASLDVLAEALAEANNVYRDEDSTNDDKTASARKLMRLIAGQSTGINKLNANGAENLKDGKYNINGKLVIVKNGQKFNANGIAF